MERPDHSVDTGAISPIREINFAQLEQSPDLWLKESTPWVLRDAVSDWPIVTRARQSAGAALDYIRQFYKGQKVSAFLGEPTIDGRFFYLSLIHI